MIKVHVESTTDSVIEVEETSEIIIEIPELSVEQFAFRAQESAVEALGYRNQAQGHRVAAETARTGAEAARDAAEASSQGIDDVLVQTEAARDITEGFRDESQGFRNDAESARNDAFQHRLASESARDDSQLARDQSQLARDHAQTAELGAVAAQGLAESARSEAETALGDAQTVLGDAQTARTGSEAARDLSQQYRDEADGFRWQAKTARTGSETARDQAGVYRDQAQSAKSAAELARDQAEDLFDQFGELYLGPHAVDPTTDNEGGPLTEGSIYFNTTEGALKFYTGTEWISPDLSAAASASDAEDSNIAAEAARDLAEGFRDDAQTAAGEAETARTGAEAAETNAGTSRVNAETAEAGAIAARNDAQTARDKAQDWAEEEEDTEVEPGRYSALHHAAKALLYANHASTSALDADGYASAASTSEGNAAASASAALQSEQNAEGHRDNAFSSASSASGSASAASTSEGNAATSASNANTSAINAAASETKAEQWAQNPEDVPVESGQYSALHHAAKAEASAAIAAQSVAAHEAASDPHEQYLLRTDAAVTNAREWTASTVTQAEAEAGTATTRRAWTAQRVRQAVVAWWGGVTSAFGRTFVNLADAAAARSNLGLGGAATLGVTNSRTSTSTSLVLRADGMNNHRTSGDHDGRYLRSLGAVSGGQYSDRLNGSEPRYFYHSTGGAPSDSPTGSQSSVLLLPNSWGEPMVAIPNSGAGLYWRNGGSTSWRQALDSNANLSDLGNAGTARTNLGLGSAATMGVSNSRTSTSTSHVLRLDGMNSHRTSGDHDGRYYTKSEADNRYAQGSDFNPSGTYSNLRAQATTKVDVGLSNIPNSTTASRWSSSTTSLLQAKAMNDHRVSGDHDGRYARRGANLSDLSNAGTARGNLGLGNAATASLDSIVARGSNSDGQWVRFRGDRLVQYNELNIGSHTISPNNGTGFTVNYPISFSNARVFNAGPRTGSAGDSSVLNVGFTNVFSGSTLCNVRNVSNFSINREINIHWICWGDS